MPRPGRKAAHRQRRTLPVFSTAFGPLSDDTWFKIPYPLFADGGRCYEPAMPMETDGELKPEAFFVSRAGVCVYVTIGRENIRVQFETIDGEGKVTDPSQVGALRAIQLARQALHLHREALAPLFEKTQA